MSGVNIAGLVEELKDWYENWSLGSRGPAILNRAADALLAQAADLAEARKAVKREAEDRFSANERCNSLVEQLETATRQRDEALAALKASEEREAGLRANLDEIAKHSHAIANIIPRGALRPSDPGAEQREAGV